MRVFKGMFRWIVNPISNPFQSAVSYCSVAPIPLNAFPAIISLLRARIYAIYSPKKVFTPSHNAIYDWFPGISVWTLGISKPSHPSRLAPPQTPHEVKGVKAWKYQVFTPKSTDFQAIGSIVWRNEPFFPGINDVYIRKQNAWIIPLRPLTRTGNTDLRLPQATK